MLGQITRGFGNQRHGSELGVLRGLKDISDRSVWQSHVRANEEAKALASRHSHRVARRSRLIG